MLNSGSSSLKYQLVEPDTGVSLAHGIVERIGEDGGVADHEAALRLAFDRLAEDGQELDSLGLVAVGHRVVHGGQTLYRPTIVDDAVLEQLRELSALAPLHNPPAVLGIEVARRVLPDLPHIAVFDTAFFHDLPAAAATYAIDRDLATRFADPPVRVSRHLAPVRQRPGRGVPRSPAGVAEPDRAASGQRGVGVGRSPAGARSTPRWG